MADDNPEEVMMEETEPELTKEYPQIPIARQDDEGESTNTKFYHSGTSN